MAMHRFERGIMGRIGRVIEMRKEHVVTAMRVANFGGEQHGRRARGGGLKTINILWTGSIGNKGIYRVD